ncbi:MAG TPA: hypothetical protein VER39_12170 [Nocardioidaceae bacterium]|nr:hypothetical protein [Nocardioidaceae bacterium]
MPLTRTECDDALVVWVASTTVGAERARLTKQVHDARSVFGVYADTSESTRRVAARLRALSGLSDGSTLIPEPHRFGSTHAAKLLPRGARAVGWLELDGYRGVAGAPQPSEEWLAEERTQLGA